MNHYAGDVAPVTKTVTYGTVADIPGEPGKCWITQNLGADHQATTVDDATEASGGWYWQFSLRQGYKYEYPNLTPSWVITGIYQISDWTASNDPCNLEIGAGFRIPTAIEWYNVNETGGWTDWNGPWNSALKLHAAGYLSYADGMLTYPGVTGTYWSSSRYTNNLGWSLYFGSTHSYTEYWDMALGFSVRCIRDE
jgi:hypothetical protein